MRPKTKARSHSKGNHYPGVIYDNFLMSIAIPIHLQLIGTSDLPHLHLHLPFSHTTSDAIFPDTCAFSLSEAFRRVNDNASELDFKTDKGKQQRAVACSYPFLCFWRKMAAGGNGKASTGNGNREMQKRFLACPVQMLLLVISGVSYAPPSPLARLMFS